MFRNRRVYPGLFVEKCLVSYSDLRCTLQPMRCIPTLVLLKMPYTLKPLALCIGRDEIFPQIGRFPPFLDPILDATFV